jgi:hypothetical protein
VPQGDSFHLFVWGRAKVQVSPDVCSMLGEVGRGVDPGQFHRRRHWLKALRATAVWMGSASRTTASVIAELRRRS